MDRAMMDTAERHGEFIAGLAAERTRLQVAQVMRVRWLATADEAWLLGDSAKVLPVAITPWCSNREEALVDAVRWPCVCALVGDVFLRSNRSCFGRTSIRSDFGGRKLREHAF